MEFDLSWLLLGLPVAFVLGWLASRLDLRQLRFDNRQAPKAYFKGLNFLLNEQQDQAIDAFIEAVQNDPDTSELHFALGNLFRRRGEFERAVRVHQHLLSRADLSLDDRHRAQHALALDFLKAGLLDRAEDALRQLEGSPLANQARLARLAIYERTREWPQAAEVARQLEANGDISFAGRLAHYLCEQAASRSAEGQMAAAEQLLRQAIADAPQAGRPRVQLARLQSDDGQIAPALATLQELAAATPEVLPLVASLLVSCAQCASQLPAARALLREHYQHHPSLDVLEALIELETAATGDAQAARQGYITHLEREPSLIAATRWLAGEKLEHQQFHPQVQRALEQASKPLSRYRCMACGFEAKNHFWQCPGCQAWDSYPPRRVEEL